MREIIGYPLSSQRALKMYSNYTVDSALMALREWQDIVRNFGSLTAVASLNSDDQIHRSRVVVDLIRIGIEPVANHKIRLQLKYAQEAGY